MTYTEMFAKQQERDAAAKRTQVNADAWRQILREYPEVLDGQANFQIVLEFCEGTITMEKFRLLLQTRPEGYGLSLATRINGVISDDRSKLIAKIMGVIDPKNIRHRESLNSKMTRRAAVGPQDRVIEHWRLTFLNEEKRLGLLTRVQLLDELERRNLRAELRSMTRQEVEQRRDAYRAKQEPPRADGYPHMPRELVLRGGVAATVLTPAALRELVRVDYHEWRRLVRLYGSAQMDERSQ